MQRITLQDGSWVDLRDEITSRGRRGIQAISMGLGSDIIGRLQNATPDTDIESLGMTEEQVDAFLRVQEATVVALVAGWSRPEPIPTLATVGDLPASLLDQLVAATAAKAADFVTSQTLDMTSGTEFDPKDPIGSSESSDGALKEPPALKSIPA